MPIYTNLTYYERIDNLPVDYANGDNWKNHYKEINHFSFCKSFGLNKIKKSRTDFYCIVCDKKLPKSTRYLGRHYERICFHCWKKWKDDSKEYLKGILDTWDGIDEDIDKNKEKWEQEIVANAL